MSHSLFFFFFFLTLFYTILAARLGATQRGRRFYGDGATELPGQRPRGIRVGSEEVH